MSEIEIHWVWWLIAAVALGVIEVLTLDLVLLMFAVGALAAIVSSMLGADITGQMLTFVVTSVLMLLFLRPYLLRNLRRRTPLTETNTAGLLRRHARTLTEVTDQSGLVKLAGEDWTARTEHMGQTIAADTPVLVVAIDGATAVVAPFHPESAPGADDPTPTEPPGGPAVDPTQPEDRA